MATTKSEKYPRLHLGFASIPYSLDDQIQRTLHEETQSWFDIEQAWTEEIGADISLSLNSYKIRASAGVSGSGYNEVDYSDFEDDNDGKSGVAVSPSLLRKNIKVREICLVVQASERLSEEAANDLFESIKKAISDSPFLDAEPWHKVNELKERQ
jgi:exopolyphosphatase